MNQPYSGPETRGGIGFCVESEIQSLPELKDYILARATAPPITGAQLAEARIVIQDEIDEDAVADGGEFTQAEGTFLGRVLDYCMEHPDIAPDFVNLDCDDGITDVVIEFPAHLEPPAELQ